MVTLCSLIKLLDACLDPRTALTAACLWMSNSDGHNKTGLHLEFSIKPVYSHRREAMIKIFSQ